MDTDEKRVRLEGVVMGTAGEVVAGYAKLRVKDRDLHRETRGAGFDLAVDGLGTVRIEIADAVALRVVGAEPLKGQWARVAESALGRLVAKAAPGNHVKVTIEGWALSAGDRVAIEGVVTEQRFEAAGDDYRDAPVTRPARVQAHALAIGKNPLAKLESPTRTEGSELRAFGLRAPQWKRSAPSAPPRPYAYAPLILVVIGLMFTSVYFALGPTATPDRRDWMYITACLSLIFLSSAVFRALRRTWPPAFIPGGNLGSVPWSGGAIDGWAAFIWFVLLFWVPFLTRFSASGVIAVDALAVAPLIQAIWIAVTERRFRRHAWMLLRAPRLGRSPEPGRWGVIEGTIQNADDAVVLKQSWRYERHSETYTHTSQDEHGHTVTTDKTRTWIAPLVNVWKASQLTVDTGQGATVTVNTRDAVFAVDGREFIHPGGTATGMFARKIVARCIECARRGDAIMVLGRAAQKEGTTVFEATGPESLWLFASSRGSARRRLWALWATSWLRVGAMLAMAAAIVTLGWWNPIAAHLTGEAVVESASGLNGITPGVTRCSFLVRAFRNDGTTHAPTNCQVELWCGGRKLYGGFATGILAPCPVDPQAGTVSGNDIAPSSSDDDPALSFDSSARTIEWSDDTGLRTSLRARIVNAHWWPW